MRDLEFLRSLSAEDLNERVRIMRIDVRKLERIKAESLTPKVTVEKLIRAIGENRASSVVASLVNGCAWDGRISPRCREWAKHVEGAWDDKAMREWCIDTTMHRAHLDQLALEMIRTCKE